MPNTTLRPLFELLQQMRKLIERLDDIDYAMPAPGRTTGGIGGHVRHCLDHVFALLTGTSTGLCTYDRRRRGTDVETSRSAAIAAISDAMIGLLGLDARTLDSEVYVETQLDVSGATVTVRSSVSREVAFLVSHTIHHNAIVGQMMRARGLEVAPRFGLAPATPIEAGEPICVR
jgi:uncharacterized damage-inducible protein DinB